MAWVGLAAVVGQAGGGNHSGNSIEQSNCGCICGGSGHGGGGGESDSSGSSESNGGCLSFLLVKWGYFTECGYKNSIS